MEFVNVVAGGAAATAGPLAMPGLFVFALNNSTRRQLGGVRPMLPGAPLMVGRPGMPMMMMPRPGSVVSPLPSPLVNNRGEIDQFEKWFF